MQFLVLGYDGGDEGALARRLAVRDAHLKGFRERIEQGTFLYGAAMLGDDGRMIGSMIVCDFPSREALDEQWLRNEPYVNGDVWKRIEVVPAQ
ncbi:MAG TPA: YciI family protein, partial [Candidatus Methylomirabilis sp.]|nr:YciI family protein [Candidatus Methylomirabilis sp.]